MTDNGKTTVRWERNAMMSAAHLTNTDGGGCFVFCSIPGGRPQFQLSPASRFATTVSGAPNIDTDAEFRRFVNERFID